MKLSNRERDYLRRYENGEAQIDIAKQEGVSKQCVSAIIVRARHKRATETPLMKKYQRMKDADVSQLDLSCLTARQREIFDVYRTCPKVSFGTLARLGISRNTFQATMAIVRQKLWN